MSAQLTRSLKSCKLGYLEVGHPTKIGPPDFEALSSYHNAINMDDREVAIQSAIADLNSGVFTSQRQAARAYGIPRSTLQGRLEGRTNRVAAHHHQQRLTPEQEDFIVQWILEEESRVQPPSHARVREMATRVLRMNGDHEPLGKLWISNFLSRQPRVASIVGRSTEAPRAEAASPAKIRAFLELFERIRIELNIRLEDIRNMDQNLNLERQGYRDS